jgi:hypothetical protein
VSRKHQPVHCPLTTNHYPLTTVPYDPTFAPQKNLNMGSGSPAERARTPPRGERQGLPGAGFQCIMPAMTIAPQAGALARRSGETDG